MNQNLSVKTAKQQRTRRRRQRRARQQKKAGKATVRRQAVSQVVNQPRRRRNRQRRRAALNGDGIVGIGNTRGQSMGKNTMIVSESEFVAAVTVANQPNFNNVAYAINPGNSTLFPWLATIASRFEKYTFTRLNFVYKKEVSEFNTAGSAGKVMMSVDFDAADPAPTSKQQIEDTVPHADAMPSQSFALNLNSSDLAHPNTIARYVRVGGLPGAADIKTYDVGNFNIATQGITQNVEIGELHVNYTVKFEKPVLEATAAPANLSVSAYSATGGEAGGATTVPYQAQMATVITNGLGAVNTAGSIVLAAGNYLIDAEARFHNSAGANLTDVRLALQKNGGGIANTLTAEVGSAGSQDLWLSSTAYYTSNGTDQLTMSLTATYGAGALTVFPQIRIVAI